jgi:ABC-type dipeptide/oligopeptide/nickel transport system permease subunit
MLKVHASDVEEVTETENGSPGQRTEREFTVKERSQWRMAFRRFLKHRLATISVVVFVLLVLFAFLGPHLWKYDYVNYTNDINVSPNGTHPFGTDETGFDEVALVMRGTQQSLKVAFIIALLGTGAGAIWGIVAGFLGGFVDSTLMRLADLILTIPALALAAALGRRGSGTLVLIGLILAGVSAPYVARVVRGVVLSLREREFIEAARALGASNSRIMFRHLLPNTTPVLIVHAADRAGHPARDGVVVRRVRHPVAGHIPRSAHHQGEERDRHPAVGLLLPGVVHHPHRPDGQLHR